MAKSAKSTGAASAKKSATATTRGTKGAAPERPEHRAGGNGAADQDRIARRAYEIYQARGGAPGLELEDWLQAERELRPASAATR